MSDNPSQNQKSDHGSELTETLLVHDKETNKIRAVKGIKRNGRNKVGKGDLETVDPTQENQNSFLKINKNGDMLSNFVRNFVSQVNNPTRFNFFKVPFRLIIAIAEKMQNFVDTTSVKGKKMIDGLKDIINSYNKNHNTMAQQQQQQNRAEYNNGYTVDKVDWSSLENLGWSREDFEKTKLMGSLLRGYKTSDLVPITIKVGSHEIETEAKLWLEQGKDGMAAFKFLPLKNEVELDKPFYGHVFTEDDKVNLMEKGNMGRAVDLISDSNDKVPHLITLDRDTNQLVSFPVDKIQIDDVIKGLTLAPEQKQTLLEGKPLHLEGMTSKVNTLFNGDIQFNAFKGHIEFLFDKNNPNKQTQEHTQSQSSEIPKVYRRKEFTVDQYDKIKNGEIVYIKDFKNPAGEEYPGYVWQNKETGKLSFDFKNPNRYKRNTATSETQKTQTSANSESKSNETIKKPNNKQQAEKNVVSNPPKRRGRRVS
ncbi:DUF3945 domain-containing protein [Chryseobacterium sp. 2987]|uniref:DUF3945 domain-containing protein n=1 Tax=Chryseobacterium sp. 2987 TaxID=2817767 RepID=UPI0028653001|nr:DUF3945 domain-containing protein [Chryseobacterium sp. 2987]MDR6919485.1 hypothetical protein [Chryseobacterium sp. 2987]